MRRLSLLTHCRTSIRLPRERFRLRKMRLSLDSSARKTKPSPSSPLRKTSLWMFSGTSRRIWRMRRSNWCRRWGTNIRLPSRACLQRRINLSQISCPKKMQQSPDCSQRKINWSVRSKTSSKTLLQRRTCMWTLSRTSIRLLNRTCFLRKTDSSRTYSPRRSKP